MAILFYSIAALALTNAARLVLFRAARAITQRLGRASQRVVKGAKRIRATFAA